MNLQQQERFYQWMTRVKANSSSRAASTTKEDAIVTEIVNGLIVSKPAKKIEHLSTKETQTSEPIVIDLQKSKAGSDVTKYYYDMSLPSTGDQVYKCGTHDYETRSLKEFNEHVALSHNDNDTGSKAGSVSGINKLKAIQEFFNSNGRM
jgi:hypothetical protein